MIYFLKLLIYSSLRRDEIQSLHPIIVVSSCFIKSFRSLSDQCYDICVAFKVCRGIRQQLFTKNWNPGNSLVSTDIETFDTVPDTHKFPLEARIRIASHARIRIASHRIACGEMRACASIRIACTKCAHMHAFTSRARRCAHMRAFASHARKCAHMRAFASHASKCAHYDAEDA